MPTGIKEVTTTPRHCIIAQSVWQGQLFGRESYIVLVRLPGDATDEIRLGAYEIATKTAFCTSRRPWNNHDGLKAYHDALRLAETGEIGRAERLLQG